VEPEWTTSHGLDLHLELDIGPGRRAAIEQSLREAIHAGRLRPGTELPSSRSLATDLGVARGTITGAFEQLVAEGWLVARRGSGTSVAWAAEQLRRPRIDAREIGAEPEPRFDFRPGTSDVSAFPRHEWVAAVRRALRTAPDAALRYGDPRGIPAVRDALATYLARARGVRIDADHVVIGTGFAQALTLLLGSFHDLGVAAVAMENPCIPAYPTSARRAGIDVALMAVDEDGADPARLDGRDHVGAVFLTPAHQYPTGTTLAPGRRAAFTAWARATGGYIVEDDYDGEFRYDRQPVGALQGMDPERIVYTGTASKSLAPGLRLGWLAVPPQLLDPIVALKELTDRQTSAVEQLALGELLSSGALDRHIRRSRLRYRRRRDELVRRLRSVPVVHPRGIAAGLHAVLDLPATGPGEADVVAHLEGRGVAVHALGRYWHRPGRRRRGLVVGYGTPPGHAYPAAVDALTSGLADLYA
jgi:GntR family transcriptional regulator/MocR family aminotransferase